MVDRAFKLSPSGVWGAASAALLLCLTFGTLAAVITRADGFSGVGPADWAAIRFTLIQATLSALISVLIAIPVARALARRQFAGRGLLVTLLGAPFILPVIVAVLGLLSVFGRAGVASTMLGAIGLPPLSIYGLHGVVLAHVFFNLPLATRLILQGWLVIPAERFRLAAALGFSSRDVVKHLEHPMLRDIVPGAFMVIFLICMTSFAVALTLGGGPKATTIELAIYQAFRFDFDLGKAALLAIVQFSLCAVAAMVAFRVSVPGAMGQGFDRAVERWDGSGWGAKLFDALLCILVAGFLLLPLTMVAVKGAGSLLSLPESLWRAAFRSVCVALGSTVVMFLITLPMAIWVVRLKRASTIIEGIGYLTISASPLVIGTGLFIILFPITDPVALALPITALVNASMSVPFCLRALLPALRETETNYGKLAESLGMMGWKRLRFLTLPRLRRPLGFCAGLTAALSMGDLGVVALFADPNGGTLPLMLYRLMAAYRMEDAAGAALLLLGLSLALFWIFDRGGRLDADAK